jgi:hypothetical protein
VYEVTSVWEAYDHNHYQRLNWLYLHITFLVEYTLEREFHKSNKQVMIICFPYTCNFIHIRSWVFFDYFKLQELSTIDVQHTFSFILLNLI